jgi:CRP-like cAMP-binding protein
VVALADSTMAVIPARPLQALLARDLTFANNVARVLAAGLLRLVDELDVSTGRSSAQRLAGYLNSLADPGDDAESCTVVLPATKTAVAARLGITKETMSRLLREMKDLGVIEVTRSRITILDRQRLAGIAG